LSVSDAQKDIPIAIGIGCSRSTVVRILHKIKKTRAEFDLVVHAPQRHARKAHFAVCP